MEAARSLDHGPLEIKTRSIEKTLLPLVKQISTLVSHEERGSGALVPSPSCRAVARVGVAVNLAVERFVTVGESIAEGNPEVREEMYDACKEARAAGGAIERLCEGASEAARERGAVVRAARCLLSSVTRVLLLADVVVVKQLLLAKDRVRHHTETNDPSTSLPYSHSLPPLLSSPCFFSDPTHP